MTQTQEMFQIEWNAHMGWSDTEPKHPQAWRRNPLQFKSRSEAREEIKRRMAFYQMPASRYRIVTETV